MYPCKALNQTFASTSVLLIKVWGLLYILPTDLTIHLMTQWQFRPPWHEPTQYVPQDYIGIEANAAKAAMRVMTDIGLLYLSPYRRTVLILCSPLLSPSMSAQPSSINK